MAATLIRKFFETFRGLHLGVSHLVRPPDYAVDSTNVGMSRTGALIGRRGFKMASQHTSPIMPFRYPDKGLYRYVYQSNGTTNEELIGVGSELFRLTTGTLSLTYSGAGTATFWVYPDPNAADIKVDLRVNGTTIGGSFPLSLGDGLVFSSVTLQTVATTIDALSDWAATLTPNAVVNGAQLARNETTPIVVDAGHTFTVSTSAPTRIVIPGYDSGGLSFLRAVDLIATTGTSLTVKPVPNTADFDLSDNQVLGVGVFPATVLPFTKGTTVTSGTTFTFSYWEPIAFGDSDDFDKLTRDFIGESNNLVMRNASNNLFVAYPTSLMTEIITENKSSLIKYDGQQAYLAGLVLPIAFTSTAVSGGSLTDGVYKYLYRSKRIDNRNNTIYSNDSVLIRGETSVTTASPNSQITVAADGFNAYSALGIRFARVNGTQAATNTVTVSGHSLRVGDVMCTNPEETSVITATSKCERRTVTSVTATTITFSGSALAFLDEQIISNNVSVEIYRTKVNGQLYYFVAELALPNVPGIAATITDNVADTALGVEYEGTFTGRRRRDMPPVLGIIENHQGLLVGAGDPEAQDKLSWSNADSPEYWPRASNFILVVSTETGPITALGSDNINNLAIFKEDSYFNLAGDLSLGGISLSSSSDGDVGCPSPVALVKARNATWVMSNKGPRAVINGSFDDFDDRLGSLFRDNTYQQVLGTATTTIEQQKLYLPHAVCGHDRENQQVIWFLPAETTDGVSGFISPNSSSRIVVYDYKNDIWNFWWFATSNINMAGGIATYKNNLYFLSRFQTSSMLEARGVLFVRNKNYNEYDFADNHTYVEQWFIPQWEQVGTQSEYEPSQEKEFLRVKVYNIFPDQSSQSEQFSPATMSIKTFRNFLVDPDTDTTVEFVNATDVELETKLRSNKCRTLLFRFGVDQQLAQFRLSGYEYSVKLPYRLDDVKK